MALTVIQEPQDLSFAGNPVIFRVQSNNYLETAGVKFVGALNKSGTFAVGQKITFQFGDNELVEMTAVAAPDDSGYQFKADAGAAITVAVFAAYFRSNYILNKYYEITTSGTNVIFTARESGEEYNWQNPAGVLSVTTSGVTAKERDNFRVMFDVFFRKNGATLYENIYSEEINSDEPFTGIFSIDISKNLNAALEHDIPDFNSPVPFKCQNSKGEYYCQYAEVYGSPAIARTPAQGAVKHVAKGGLSHVGFKTKALLNILKPDAGSASKDLFLKQGSRKLRVRTNQPEFLYFLNLRGHTSLQLKIQIEYTAGLPHTVESAAVTTVTNDKVCFAAGHDLLNLGSYNPTRTIKQYKCWLVNQAAAVVSETVTYVVDYERREVVRYFCASSSMGGVDTLPAFGKGSEEFEVTQSTAEKPLPLNYELKDGRVANYDLRIQRSFQVATGFLDKRRFDLLADFFLAEKKYLVKGVTALPITVTNQKAGQYKDKQGLITQGIEYRYNHYDHQYTEGDAEEPGDYIEGFFFTSNLGGSLTGSETDPTVGAHIKAISPQQISGWDAMYTAWQSGGIGGGSSSTSWGNITGDILNQQDLQDALNNIAAGGGNFIKNQTAQQPGAKFFVDGGKFGSYIIAPKVAPAVADMEIGEYYEYVRESGSGAIGTEGFGIFDLINTSMVIPLAQDQVLRYNATTGKFENSDANFGGTPIDTYTKSQINSFFGGTSTIAGYNKSNWDAAYAATLDSFIKNQNTLQPGAEFYVNRGRTNGLNVYSYFSGPKAAPAISDMEVGEYYEYILENGSGATGSSGMGLFDLQGTQQVGAVTDGQVLKYNGTTGKWENSADGGGGSGDAYTKTESDGRFVLQGYRVGTHPTTDNAWDSTFSGGKTVLVHSPGPITEAPSTASWGVTFAHGTNGNYLAQLAFRDHYFKFRTRENGVNGSWNNVWHSGNFSPANYALLSGSNFTGPVTFLNSITFDTGNSRKGITLTSDSPSAFNDIVFQKKTPSTIATGKPVAWQISHRSDGFFSGDTGGPTLEFYANKQGGGYMSPMAFASNGNLLLVPVSGNSSGGSVGIGTQAPTPGYILDVIGSTRMEYADFILSSPNTYNRTSITQTNPTGQIATFRNSSNVNGTFGGLLLGAMSSGITQWVYMGAVSSTANTNRTPNFVIGLRGPGTSYFETFRITTTGDAEFSSSIDTIALKLRTGDTTRGHIYADSENNIGFLNNGGQWALKVTEKRHVIVDVALIAPSGAPATADMVVGKYYEYIRAI